MSYPYASGSGPFAGLAALQSQTSELNRTAPLAPHRQSTQESAAVAEGIFDLYGGGAGERNSVVSAASVSSYRPDRPHGRSDLLSRVSGGDEGVYGQPRGNGQLECGDGNGNGNAGDQISSEGRGHARMMSDASTSTIGLPYDREPDTERGWRQRIRERGEGYGQEVLQGPADSADLSRSNGHPDVNERLGGMSIAQPGADIHTQPLLHEHSEIPNTAHSYPGPIDFTASPTTPLFRRPQSYAGYGEAGGTVGSVHGAEEENYHVLDSPTGLAQAQHVQDASGEHRDGGESPGAGHGGNVGGSRRGSLRIGQSAPRVTITPDVTPHKERSSHAATSTMDWDNGSIGIGHPIGAACGGGTARNSNSEPDGDLRLSTMTNATTTTASTSFPSHSQPPSRGVSPSPSPSPIPDRLHPYTPSSASSPSRLPVPHASGTHTPFPGINSLHAAKGPRESLASSASHGSLSSYTNGTGNGTGSRAGSVRTYVGEDTVRRVQMVEPGREMGGQGQEQGFQQGQGQGQGQAYGQAQGYGADQSMGNISTSQFSHVGSTRGKGEEEDAWHVRSTYARLESEGVFGDGWDPGVERTRGGPSMASKRQTVMTPRRGSEVGDKEKSYLASLDRYGFVQEPLRNRNESRLALIRSAPFSRIPKLPRSSPLASTSTTSAGATTNGHGSGAPTSAMAMAARGPGGEPPSPPLPPSSKVGGGGGGRTSLDGQRRGSTGSSRRESVGGHDTSKEVERTEKWMRMMGVKRKEGGNAVEWVWKGEGVSKLRRRIYKGVPDRWRMAAWWTLTEEAAARDASGSGKGKKKAEDLEGDYKHAIDLPSPHDVQIDLDVPRTISGHTLFVTRYGSGQRSLFHVLHSFSLLCDTCGYCQGMGPLAATFLCYFDPERAYALMVRLHDQYGMHDIFAPGFPGLLEAFYVMERMVEWIMPDVYRTFRDNMISTSAWATKWYITLFVNTVPFSTQLRIWDALLLDGRDVVIITALAILWAYKDLLAHPLASFESILSLLSSHYVPEDEDAMMRWIKRMLHQQGVQARMNGWREEWVRLKREGKDGEALL